MRVLARQVAVGEASAADVARRVNAAIAEKDGTDGIHAFLSHDPALLDARGAALDRELEAARSAGRAAPPLAGVPVALKDNLCTLDYPTTCGSRILEGYRSPYEATVVRRLRAAGALIAGKTNMDEFAMGSSTEHSAWGPTRNPHDPTRVPGGSSGGSAAAVAAGLVAAALGSDTAGSVRQPAALCGVVGLKPTWGAVSRYGLVAFASSLDQVGILGRTVADAARLLEVIGGRDPLDSTCADRAALSLVPEAPATGDAREGTARSGSGEWPGWARGLVVGLPDEYFPPELDPGVRARTDAAVRALENAGAELRRVSLPSTTQAIPAYYVIGPAEASSNLARFDGVRYGRRTEASTADGTVRATRSHGFGEEVRRRILLGTYVLSAGREGRYRERALAARLRIGRELDAVFASGVDVLFTPTTPSTAFPLGDRSRDPYGRYLADVFTVPANLAGIPAISLPIGLSDGLPVGGQFLAPRWQERIMVRAAAGLERALEGLS